MKKRTKAVFAAAALILGLSMWFSVGTTVKADSVSGNDPQSTEPTFTVGTPVWGSGDNAGTYSFTISNISASESTQLLFEEELTCNGTTIRSFNDYLTAGIISQSLIIGPDTMEVTYSGDVIPYINESGNYVLKIRVGVSGADKSTFIESETATYTYSRPAQQLPTATNLAWSSSTEGLATWEFEDVPDLSMGDFYVMPVLYRVAAGTSGGSGTGVLEWITSKDFSSQISNTDEYDWYFNVQVFSRRIETYAHGSISANSAYLTTTEATQSVNDQVAAAATQNNATAVQTLKDIDTAQLQTAMQNNTTTRSTVASIENSYASANNITISTPVSEVSGIDASQISVVGAALNVSSGSTVGLNLSTLPQPDISSSNYIAKILAFDMTLKDGNGNEINNASSLEVPVTITIPVPSGFNTSYTQIVHIHANGTQETITPSFTGNTMTFTVTGFSEFRIVERIPQNNNSGSSNNGSGSSGSSGSSGGAGTSAIASSAVELYRLFNPKTGEHLYTVDANEKAVLVENGWNDEGVRTVASSEDTPVYRMYHAGTKEHLFVATESEKEAMLANGWTMEGIGWYANAKSDTPNYRLFNGKSGIGSHLFTTSKDEADQLVEQGWTLEGIAWFE